MGLVMMPPARGASSRSRRRAQVPSAIGRYDLMSLPKRLTTSFDIHRARLLWQGLFARADESTHPLDIAEAVLARHELEIEGTAVWGSGWWLDTADLGWTIR